MKTGRAAAVGLTGGIGSGKSTVARMFAELEVPVLDLDEVGRGLTGPDQPGLKLLLKAFGTKLLNSDKTLNRQRLSALVFGNDKKLKCLTGILHPLIWEEEERWLCRVSGPYAIIEAAVLLESGGAVRMDAIVALVSPLALRRQRVGLRGHPSVPRFDEIVKSQCDDEKRMRYADFIIHNNEGLEELRDQVIHTHQLLLKRYINQSTV